MNSPFLKLSTPVKIGLVCCLIILAVVSIILLGGDKRAVLIVLAGLVLVLLLLLLYVAFIKWQEKRKAEQMGVKIREEGQRKVRGISDPNALAKISDLSRQFAEGIEKFRAAGKNLYSLPWYLLIGESGSGKSEAIRHCNVGFPPGLQDMLQGSGGTVNMNWWFTNHAVILDTAGRYISQQILPGSTNEWTEFLKLLNRSRPNCPINGLLLTISAESLIKFTADQLEAEAGKIARQLDTLQRVLGVRFPVFVIITKSDLIVGFREFFESVTDPRMQHQILGWSNSNENLDAPFSAEQVTQHLETVKQRLLKRRMGLLL
ncbi:MAG: type VI secretion protein IcmF/TssM N-terminal domain-containing protein, partial [Tepidisphaeraceae bacterium]